MFEAFCDLFIYAQGHFATTAEELAGIIFTHPRKQFNIFVLDGQIYRVGCIAGHDQMLDLKLPRADIGAENVIGCSNHEGSLGEVQSICRVGFEPGECSLKVKARVMCSPPASH